MAELRGTGKTPRRWVLDRTSITDQTPTERTVIPLDQIDHVWMGKQSKPAMLALVAVGLVVAVASYLLLVLGRLSETLMMVGAAAGLLIALAGFLLFVLGRGDVLMLATRSGEFTLQHAIDSDAEAFVETVFDARNAYLEGIDTVE